MNKQFCQLLLLVSAVCLLTGCGADFANKQPELQKQTSDYSSDFEAQVVLNEESVSLFFKQNKGMFESIVQRIVDLKKDEIYIYSPSGAKIEICSYNDSDEAIDVSDTELMQYAEQYWKLCPFKRTDIRLYENGAIVFRFISEDAEANYGIYYSKKQRDSDDKNIEKNWYSFLDYMV